MSTIHEFDFNGQAIVSIVVSPEEWDDFINLLFSMNRVIERQSGKRMTDEQIDAIRDAKHIQMIARGTLTEKLFDHFSAPTHARYMTVIVRGQGMKVFNEHFGNPLN